MAIIKITLILTRMMIMKIPTMAVFLKMMKAKVVVQAVAVLMQ